MILISRLIQKSIVIIIDICSCFFSVWIAYYLRTGEVLYFISINQFYAVILAIFLAIPILTFFGIYREIFRYSNSPLSSALLKSILIFI